MSQTGLGILSETPSPLLGQKKTMDVGGSLREEKGVYISAFERSANSDYVLHYLIYLMIDGLNSLFLNFTLYWEGYDWSELLHYFPLSRLLSDVFQNLIDFPVSL